MPKISSIHWAVLFEQRLVIDRQTQGHNIYRASIASRGKNWTSLRKSRLLCVYEPLTIIYAGTPQTCFHRNAILQKCLLKQRKQVSRHWLMCICSMPWRPGQMSQHRSLYISNRKLLWWYWWLWRRVWWTSQLQWVTFKCVCFVLLSRDTLHDMIWLF